MNTARSIAPRILILESDRKTCDTLRRHTVKGLRGSSVQSNTTTLADVVGGASRLKTFDVVLVGCDFSSDGSAAHPVFGALRALYADPDSPPVILLTHGGSEYTAIQAIKSGAFDCIPRHLLGRHQLLESMQKAMSVKGRADVAGTVSTVVKLFGYDVRRCLAHHDDVSVHVAYSAERAQEVVLKLLHRGRGSLSRDGAFGRFIEEFMLLYDVEDPSVAEIYDFRVTGQYCCIAMEYFSAGHLGQKLTGALPVDEALRIARKVAEALSILHAAGIVHRDLKPGNIMLRGNGSLALIDFGIAQSTSLTGTSDGSRNVVTGTPYYMSPEQARGDDTDERTDLYALGVILFQMLTGEKPYVGSSTDEILQKHLNAPVPDLPSDLGHFQTLIDRLLAKRADQRPASSRELIEALESARGLQSATAIDFSATSA